MVICFRSKARFIMRCQSDGNHDDWLRHHYRRFHRCCGVKGRRLKSRCDRNPASAKHREMVVGFCEGDTRNRWRDGQVCPDVDKELWRLGPDGSGVFWRWTSVSRCGQGTMAPWARRLGCVLACYAPIGRGRLRETLEEREKKGKEGKKKDKRVRERERTEGGGRRKRERGDGKRVGERESEARLEWRKGLSPEIGVKKTMNAGGVENGNMN
ncbi:hypothetical protein TNCV_3397671 [Trichonephila clavipes]|nr:hypothetical protein TNCV_3397671 [Trichonephila clavipes]